MIPKDFGTSLGSSSHENVRNKESFPKIQAHRMFQIDDYATTQGPIRGSLNKGELIACILILKVTAFSTLLPSQN